MSILDRERIRLRTLQKIIDPDLARFEAELARIMAGGSPLAREICDHLQQGKSKRFRPTLLLLAAKDEAPVDQGAVVAAACVELVHTATLVHDDFIDGAVVRRGLPSVNHAWGGAAALIMGDYLYAKAIDDLCGHGLHDAVGALARSTVAMSQAEIMQVELRYSLATTEEQYLQVIERKTASLIATACELGASFHPRVRTERAAFGEFGRKVGLVFQITDDIFDYLGDERRLGKPTGQDWEEGRVTLPLIAALRQAPAAERAAFLDACRDRRGEPWLALWPQVKAFVATHDGVSYARALARRFGDEAKAEIAPIARGAQRELLETAAEYVIHRLN